MAVLIKLNVPKVFADLIAGYGAGEITEWMQEQETHVDTPVPQRRERESPLSFICYSAHKGI